MPHSPTFEQIAMDLSGLDCNSPTPHSIHNLLHIAYVLNATIGITGLPSYRTADHVLLLFFKIVINVKEVNPYHLPISL
jgi:hypothetical protein